MTYNQFLRVFGERESVFSGILVNLLASCNASAICEQVKCLTALLDLSTFFVCPAMGQTETITQAGNLAPFHLGCVLFRAVTTTDWLYLVKRIHFNRVSGCVV